MACYEYELMDVVSECVVSVLQMHNNNNNNNNNTG